MKIKSILLAVLLCTSLAIVGCGTGSTLDDENQVRASVTATRLAGESSANIVLVWQFEVADGWHLYGPGRNDSGFPPTVELELPAGWQAGPLQWPAPERHLSEGDILDHVFYRELVLLQEISVAEGFGREDDFSITGEVSWLACRGMCVPGEADVLIGEVSLANSAFETAQAQLPLVWDEDVLQAHWAGTTLQVKGPDDARLVFMPDNDCGNLADLIADGTGEALNIRFRTDAGLVGPARGLITIEKTGAPRRSYRVDIPAISLPPESLGG